MGIFGRTPSAYYEDQRARRVTSYLSAFSRPIEFGFEGVTIRSQQNSRGAVFRVEKQGGGYLTVDTDSSGDVTLDMQTASAAGMTATAAVGGEYSLALSDGVFTRFYHDIDGTKFAWKVLEKGTNHTLVEQNVWVGCTAGGITITIDSGFASGQLITGDWFGVFDQDGNAAASPITISNSGTMNGSGDDLHITENYGGYYGIYDGGAETWTVWKMQPAGSSGLLKLTTDELTVVDGDILGRIDFCAPLESSGGDALLNGASIWAEAADTFDATTNTTDLILATGTSENATESLRLLGLTKWMGLNVTPARELHVNGASTQASLLLTDSSTGVTNTDGCLLGIFGTEVFLWNYEANNLHLGTSAATRVTITTQGRVGVGTLAPVSTLETDGSRGIAVHDLDSATLTLDATHEFIKVDYTATGAVTITLPSATSSWNSTDNIGRTYTIADSGFNAGTNNITINRAGSDTIVISGASATETSAVIVGNGDVIRIIAVSSSQWMVY